MTDFIEQSQPLSSAFHYETGSIACFSPVNAHGTDPVLAGFPISDGYHYQTSPEATASPSQAAESEPSNESRSGVGSKKKSRIARTPQQKLDLIALIEVEPNTANACKRLNVAFSTYASWVLNKEAIVAQALHGDGNWKRNTGHLDCPAFEKKIVGFFKAALEKGEIVSFQSVFEYAKAQAEDLKHEHAILRAFKPTKVWIKRFVAKNGFPVPIETARPKRPAKRKKVPRRKVSKVSMSDVSYDFGLGDQLVVNPGFTSNMLPDQMMSAPHAFPHMASSSQQLTAASPSLNQHLSHQDLDLEAPPDLLLTQHNLPQEQMQMSQSPSVIALHHLNALQEFFKIADPSKLPVLGDLRDAISSSCMTAGDDLFPSL